MSGQRKSGRSLAAWVGGGQFCVRRTLRATLPPLALLLASPAADALAQYAVGSNSPQVFVNTQLLNSWGRAATPPMAMVRPTRRPIPLLPIRLIRLTL